MSILDRFEAVDGRERRPELWRKPAVVALTVESTHEARDAGEGEGEGFAMQSRYILRAQLGVEFWANRAQCEDALKIARRVMLARIYERALPMIHELRHAVFNRDADAALAMVDALEKEMTE